MPETRLGALPDGIYGPELERRIRDAAGAIRGRLAAAPGLEAPRLVFVLGSGLGGVVELLDAKPRIRMGYGEIPHIPLGHVEGHAGELVAGLAAGTPAAGPVRPRPSVRGVFAPRGDHPPPRMPLAGGRRPSS